MNAGTVALLAGLSIFFAIYALFAPKKPLTRDDIREDFFGDTQAGSGTDSFGRYVRPMLKNFLPQAPMGTTLSERQRDKIAQLLVRSGNPWNLRPEEYRGTQWLFALLGLIAGFVIGAMELLPGVTVFTGAPLMAVIGYALPYSVYNTAKERRARSIQKQLPDALDLLVVTMTSGQNFEPALAQVTPRLPEGILKEEFAKVSAEITAGRTLDSSLMSFAHRAASDEAEYFAKAVAQSQRLGADVSQTLAGQARAARDAYEAMLDKKIARVSSQMFMALIPTMLPAFLLIFVAPSLSQLSGGLM